MMIFGFRLVEGNSDIEQIEGFFRTQMKVPDSVLNNVNIREVIKLTSLRKVSFLTQNPLPPKSADVIL